jgi:hypothetical protein
LATFPGIAGSRIPVCPTVALPSFDGRFAYGPYPVAMTGWLEYIQYRYALALSGVMTVVIATTMAMVLAMSVAGGTLSEFPWRGFLFAPLVLLLIVVGLTLVMRPWRYSADITAMRAGNAWVHWTYDEASWRAATRYGKRKSALSPVRVPARAQRAARGEIYISRHGIYWQPGGYMPLDLRHNIRYESVELVERPTPHIHIEVMVPGSTIWVRQTLTDVGVPPGHEDEARALVKRLRREVVDVSRRSVAVCAECVADGERSRASATSRGDGCDHDGW